MSHVYKRPSSREEQLLGIGEYEKLAIYIGGLHSGDRKTSSIVRTARYKGSLGGNLELYSVLSSGFAELMDGNTNQRSTVAGNLHHLARHYPDSRDEVVKVLWRLSRDSERTVSARALGGLARTGASLREVLSQAVSMSTGDDDSFVVIPRDGDYYINVRYLLQELEKEGE